MKKLSFLLFFFPLLGFGQILNPGFGWQNKLNLTPNAAIFHFQNDEIDASPVMFDRCMRNSEYMVMGGLRILPDQIINEQLAHVRMPIYLWGIADGIGIRYERVDADRYNHNSFNVSLAKKFRLTYRQSISIGAEIGANWSNQGTFSPNLISLDPLYSTENELRFNGAQFAGSFQYSIMSQRAPMRSHYIGFTYRNFQSGMLALNDRINELTGYVGTNIYLGNRFRSRPLSIRVIYRETQGFGNAKNFDGNPFHSNRSLGGQLYFKFSHRYSWQPSWGIFSQYRDYLNDIRSVGIGIDRESEKFKFSLASDYMINQNAWNLRLTIYFYQLHCRPIYKPRDDQFDPRL